MGAVEHFLCGTCRGEYVRECGYFESGRRRAAVGQPKIAPKGMRETYCCNCGQKDSPAATFFQKPGSTEPCDGVHEEPED